MEVSTLQSMKHKALLKFEKIRKNKIFCVLYAVQSENMSKTVLVIIQQSKNKDVLITVHKNQTIKE